MDQEAVMALAEDLVSTVFEEARTRLADVAPPRLRSAAPPVQGLGRPDAAVPAAHTVSSHRHVTQERSGVPVPGDRGARNAQREQAGWRCLWLSGPAARRSRCCPHAPDRAAQRQPASAHAAWRQPALLARCDAGQGQGGQLWLGHAGRWRACAWRRLSDG